MTPSSNADFKIKSISEINSNLVHFRNLEPYPLKPFWDHMMPPFDSNPFWGNSKRRYPATLFISGPGRNGNHLLHSMLDSHPQLARMGGEDSFLAAFFKDACLDVNAAVSRLLGPDNLDYVLNLSGCGVNKWKLTAQLNEGGAIRKTDVWAGVHDERQFASDYQDTAVKVNYRAYESKLRDICPQFSSMDSFVDIFWAYLEAVACLDERNDHLTFPHIYVGSGMRAEMSFLFSRVDNLWCVAPIRPFESFYFSFAKGRKRSEEIHDSLIQEAWEHWSHKAIDYLLLKKMYPDRVCLVNFEHLILSPEKTSRQLCDFLKIPYSASCLVPTSLGIPTKGNSSFPKGEESRGKVYSESLSRKLSSQHIPDGYAALWKMVDCFSI